MPDNKYICIAAKKNEKLISEKAKIAFEDYYYDPKDKFDSSSTPEILAGQLQEGVDKIIQNCHNVDWNEDNLSYQVIKTIRDILSRYHIPNIEYNSNISKFDIEAYKLTGKAEKNHGDIAIVVSRTFRNSPPSLGVGFYEAKKSSLRHGQYSAFNIQQLRRLVTKTPKLSYLLYDKEGQFSDNQEWPTLKEEERNKYNMKKHYVQTVDANFLKQCRDIRKAVHIMGQSFGYHFVNKILSGRELDYSRPPIETIRQWLKSTGREEALVVSIAIQEEVTKPISAQLKLPGFEHLKLQTHHGKKIQKPPNTQQKLL